MAKKLMGPETGFYAENTENRVHSMASGRGQILMEMLLLSSGLT